MKYNTQLQIYMKDLQNKIKAWLFENIEEVISLLSEEKTRLSVIDLPEALAWTDLELAHAKIYERIFESIPTAEEWDEFYDFVSLAIVELLGCQDTAELFQLLNTPRMKEQLVKIGANDNPHREDPYEADYTMPVMGKDGEELDFFAKDLSERLKGKTPEQQAIIKLLDCNDFGSQEHDLKRAFASGDVMCNEAGAKAVNAAISALETYEMLKKQLRENMKKAGLKQSDIFPF